ncbi:MAG: ABC transporter permease [bacterium]|nr:ABC transporter permease [bacterium]
MSIWIYILKRIFQSLPIIILVTIISFFLIRLSPIDPLAELKLNPAVSKQTVESEVKRLGLDKPIPVQYFYWAKNFVKGDMGTTTTGEKVSNKIKERVLNTLLLSLNVIFWTWLIGIPIGIIAALNYRSAFDRMLTALSSA